MLQCIPRISPKLLRWLHPDVMKSRDFAPNGIGFAHREVLRQECIGVGIPSGEVCFVAVEPRLRFAEQKEWKQPKMDVIHRSTSGVDSITHF